MSQIKLSWNQLLSRLGGVAQEEFIASFQEAFSKSDDYLFNLSQSSSEHMEAVRVFRQRRPDLLKDWTKHFESKLTSWGVPSRGESSLELSLVSNDELEEKLAYDQMSDVFQKAHERNFKALEGVWAAASAATPSIDASKSPLTASGLAECVGSWLSSTDVSLGSRLVALKIFERELNKNLDGILNKFIANIQEAGWSIDAPKAFEAKEQQKPEPENVTVDNLPNLEAVAPLMERPLLDQEPLLNDLTLDELAPADLQDEFDKQIKLLDQQVEADKPSIGSSPSFQGETRRVVAAPRPRDFSARSAAIFVKALHQLLDGALTQEEQENLGSEYDQVEPTDWDPSLAHLVNLLNTKRATATPRTADQVMPRAAVRSVLDVFQHNVPSSIRKAAVDGSVSDTSLSQQFKKEIIIRGHEMGISPTSAQFLDEKDEDAVDIVGMLFEVFLSERNLENNVKEKITQLLAPYAKVAIADKKVFMHRQHPARRLLDVLAEACEGNHGTNHHEQEVLQKVSDGIEKLSADFREDAVIFELIEEELRGFVHQQKNRVALAEKRAAEAQRGRERLERAREQAMETFTNKISMHNWPVNTIDILRQYWCQHHTTMLLRQQANPADVTKSLGLIDNLILIGVKGVTNIEESPVAVHEKIIDMLSTSGLVDQTAQDVAMDIWSCLDQAHRWSSAMSSEAAQKLAPSVKLAAIAQVPPEPTERDLNEQAHPVNELLAKHIHQPNPDPLRLNETISAPEISKPEEQVVLRTRDDLIKYFQKMPLGTWVDFIKEDASVTSVKLSWVSPISQRLLFVNRRGLQYAVESAEDLSMMVILGKLRLRDTGLGEQGFDHSFQRALAEMQKNAAARVAEEGKQKPSADIIPLPLAKKTG